MQCITNMTVLYMRMLCNRYRRKKFNIEGSQSVLPTLVDIVEIFG